MKKISVVTLTTVFWFLYYLVSFLLVFITKTGAKSIINVRCQTEENRRQWKHKYGEWERKYSPRKQQKYAEAEKIAKGNASFFTFITKIFTNVDDTKPDYVTERAIERMYNARKWSEIVREWRSNVSQYIFNTEPPKEETKEPPKKEEPKEPPPEPLQVGIIDNFLDSWLGVDEEGCIRLQLLLEGVVGTMVFAVAVGRFEHLFSPVKLWKTIYNDIKHIEKVNHGLFDYMVSIFVWGNFPTDYEKNEQLREFNRHITSEATKNMSSGDKKQLNKIVKKVRKQKKENQPIIQKKILKRVLNKKKNK